MAQTQTRSDSNTNIPARRATIRDVAAKAGVSVTTVSHFVSGRGGICSAETAARISQVISELRYVPNGVAQDLGKRSTRTIGVCLESPAEGRGADRGSFAHRIWRGIVRVADREDYLLLQYPKSIRYGASVDMFVNGRTDGIIMASWLTDSRPVRIWQHGTPVVAIVMTENVPDGIGAVYADENLTVSIALEHLWGLGHRDIVHFAGPVSYSDTPEGWTARPVDIAIRRQDAFIAWMEQHGCSRPRIVQAQSWRGFNVPDAVRSLFEDPARPTALFCANDEIALRAVDAARQIGWDVPGQVSIVGVDNLDAGDKSSPGLTTVEVDADEIGEQAARLVLALSQGQAPQSLRIEVEGAKLIERASTCARIEKPRQDAP